MAPTIGIACVLSLVLMMLMMVSFGDNWDEDVDDDDHAVEDGVMVTIGMRMG